MEQSSKPERFQKIPPYGVLRSAVSGGAWLWRVCAANKLRLVLLVSLVAAFGTLLYLQTRPAPQVTLLDKARQVYNGGHYTESAEILRQELKLNPTNNPARLLLAQSLINLHRWPESSATLNTALQAEPQNSLILYWLGRGQYLADNLPAAEATWQIILARPDKSWQELYPRANYGLGLVRFRQGRLDESSKLLYEALTGYTALDALEQQEAFYLYSLLLARDLRWNDSLNALQKAQKVSLPGSEYDNIPRKAAYERQAEKIRTLLERLPTANAQKVETARRALLGYAFILTEEYSLAEEQLLQVLKVTPKYADARGYLALVYWRIGRGDKAFTTFQTALADAPDSRFVRQMFVEFLLDRLATYPSGSSDFQADSEKIRQLLDRLVTEAPSDAALQILLGRYFMTARHDYQTGVKHYEDAAKYNRGQPVAGLNPNAMLARYYSESNVNPCVRGVDSGLAATRELPNDAESWFAAGQAYRLCGHAKLAAPMFEKGLELQPYRTDLLYNLALSYDMLGRRADADRLFRLLDDLDPTGTYFRAGKS